MIRTISHQKARQMVSALKWKFIQRGYECYSHDLKFVVYKAGYLYRCRALS